MCMCVRVCVCIHICMCMHISNLFTLGQKIDIEERKKKKKKKRSSISQDRANALFLKRDIFPSGNYFMQSSGNWHCFLLCRFYILTSVNLEYKISGSQHIDQTQHSWYKGDSLKHYTTIKKIFKKINAWMFYYGMHKGTTVNSSILFESLYPFCTNAFGKGMNISLLSTAMG